MNEFLAGALSGFGQTIIGHPFDTIKVRLQNNSSVSNLKPSHYYRGVSFPLLSSSIINSIIFSSYYKTINHTNNKILSGFLSGLIAGPVVYVFDIYKTKRQMNYKIKLNTFLKSKGFLTALSRESIAFSTYFVSYDYFKQQNFGIALSGSLSGLINWTITYPLDVIRNRQMATNINFTKAYKKGDLWKGYNICALRALLVNSVGFYIYETCFKFLENY